MTDTRSGTIFDSLVASGRPVGEVISVDKFLIRVRGLHPVSIGSMIVFQTGTRGFVRRILVDFVEVLHLGVEAPEIGTVAVVQHEKLTTNVGTGLVGRVLSVEGVPLDGKGPIVAEASWPVFNQAPKIHERELLNEQVVSGVTALDSLFPLVKGQRLAIIGDSKSGKTSLATQLGINQKDTGGITVYVLIAKRTTDINLLIGKLEQSGAMEKSIVVVSTIFDSLVTSYLAPYVACAIGEYLWQVKDTDVVMIYDDLTSHAHIYREISLVSRSSPGRDSYPGDIFYIHSSLLERAGKLVRNHKSLTALPIVLAAGNDITAYLPTNIISITDGQWILDKNLFHDGIRPAVSTGLSVTRVGGRGHSDGQKAIASRAFKAIAGYKQALEFSHFGSDLALATSKDLKVGAMISQILTQMPSDSYPVLAQQVMLDIILSLEDGEEVDTKQLKASVNQTLANSTNESDYDQLKDTVKVQSLSGGIE